MKDQNETYFRFLDELREIGSVNMFGARVPLMEMFPELDKQEASAVLGEWMRTFSKRHPQ